MKDDLSDYLDVDAPMPGLSIEAVRKSVKEAASARRASQGKVDNVSVIEVDSDQARVNDEAMEALRRDPNLFQRAGRLVTVLRTEHASAADPPVVVSLTQHTLRDRLARVALWERYCDRDKGMVQTCPPSWCVGRTLDLGSWPLPDLDGIVTYPLLRPDGTVCDKPGYDPAMRVWIALDADLGVSARPTPADAQRAVADLLDLVSDFPFLDDKARTAWLCALLTPLARFAMRCATPLFFVLANLRGSGKTTLVDLINVILTGEVMPSQAFPRDNDAELEKLLGAIALAGTPCVNFDNVSGLFGSPVLDKWLTARSQSIRILGTSDTKHLQWNTVLYATGNNCAVRDDTVRRVVWVPLKTDLDRPHERSEFKYRDLIGHARAQRSRYLCAALTVLRAYQCAGQPEPAEPHLHKGSYAAWTRLVRDAVMWAGDLPDCERREGEVGGPMDVDTMLLDQLMEAWLAFTKGKATTISEAVRALEEYRSRDQGFFDKSETVMALDRLRDVFSEIDGGGPPNARKISRVFMRHKDRWLAGRCLECELDAHSKVLRWTVRQRPMV